MIDDFVRLSSARMSEAALYKTAALIFQRDIREPAEKEGVSIPGWAWQDIAMHYSIHIVDPRHQRQEDLRSLSTVRKHLEDNLMRVDTETGEQSLDKDNAKLLLAVIAASEKNIDREQRARRLRARGGGGHQQPRRAQTRRRCRRPCKTMGASGAGEGPAGTQSAARASSIIARPAPVVTREFSRR